MAKKIPNPHGKKVGNTFLYIWLRIIQVGRVDEKQQPVKREKEAIKDIEKSTGIEVEYYDYETKKKIK